MTTEHPNDPRRPARSKGSQPASRRKASRFVPLAPHAEPLLVHVAEIGGRYKLTITVPAPGRANDVHVYPTWSPRQPNDLSRAELLQVYEAAQKVSERVAILLRRETCTHLHVPSTLCGLQISRSDSNPATPPKGET